MKIRFTQEELDMLTKKSQMAGYSREEFCRQILNGAIVKEAPSVEVLQLVREVRRVGYHMDQILKHVNGKGLVDVSRLRTALEENRMVEKQIIGAYTGV